MMNSELEALLTKKAKINKDKTNVIFCRVSNDDYADLMKKRGRLQTAVGENISITDFVLKAIKAFVVE
jgi:hypothetical protein